MRLPRRWRTLDTTPTVKGVQQAAEDVRQQAIRVAGFAFALDVAAARLIDDHEEFMERTARKGGRWKPPTPPQ